MIEQTQEAPFSVYIRWGEDNTRREVYAKGNRGVWYGFDTQQELVAFLEGVDTANGWMDYVITEQNGVEFDNDDDIYDDEDEVTFELAKPISDADFNRVVDELKAGHSLIIGVTHLWVEDKKLFVQVHQDADPDKYTFDEANLRQIIAISVGDQ